MRGDAPSPERLTTVGSTSTEDGGRALHAAVVAAWEEVIGEAPSPGVGFFDAGGDSRAAVQLLDALHKRLGVRITLREFFAAPTLEALVEAVTTDDRAAALRLASTRTVFRLSTSGERVLWCFFPALPGLAAAYVRMPRLLPPGHAVWACTTPLERGAGDMASLTRVLASTLRSEGADRFERVHLAGYSLGGTLALETARALSEGGRAPDWLGEIFLLDPTPPCEEMTPDEALEIFINRALDIKGDPYAFLQGDGGIDAAKIIAGARAAGVVEMVASENDIRQVWATVLANARMLAGYAAHPLADRCPWLLCSAETDEVTPQASAEARLTRTDEAGPWAAIVPSEHRYRLPVSHADLLRGGNIELIARWMIDAAELADR